MAKRKVYITSADAERLWEILQTGLQHNRRDAANLMVLRDELRRATIVAPDEVTPDVVTMHSTVRVVDRENGERSEFTLVFPDEVESVYSGISVVAPMGAAVLGYRVGDRIRFRTPGGQRTLEIEEVLYQPEAAGHLVA